MKYRITLTALAMMIFLANTASARFLNFHGANADIQVRGTDDVVEFVPIGIHALPLETKITADGLNAQAAANVLYSELEFSATDVAYALKAAGEKSTFAQLACQVRFTPQIDLKYKLSGAYQWTGQWANGFGLFAQIRNTDTDQIVTLHYYDSAGVLDSVNYTVGKGVGNVSNKVGPTTGTLLAGVKYEYYYVLSVDNNRFSPQQGNAQGWISLTLDPGPCNSPPGDFNGDCQVNIEDLAILARLWTVELYMEDFAAISGHWTLDCYLEPENPSCLIF